MDFLLNDLPDKRYFFILSLAADLAMAIPSSDRLSGALRRDYNRKKETLR
jgi:hypothetical protein